MPLWTPSTRSAQPTFPSAPALNDFQFQINGANGSLTIGPGTAYVITEITGLGDLPVMRLTDVPRPRATGEYAGFDYAAGRDVVIKLWVSSQYGGGTAIQALLGTLAAVMVPSANTEYPLWFNFPVYPTMALVCRPRKKSAPMNINWANSGVAEVTLEFHATDPVCYAADAPTTINFSASSGVLVFPFTSPLTYAGTTVSGSIVNSGNFPSDCLIEFTAVSTDAFIASTTSDQALGLVSPVAGAGDLNTGDVLWMDTRAKSVVYWPSGGGVGQTQRGWLEAGSEWFSAVVGTTNFKIGSASSSGGAHCVVHAPGAYLL